MTEGFSVGQRKIDELCINTIRTLSIDAVQKANSGHPGAPMGLAPGGTLLEKFGFTSDHIVQKTIDLLNR